MDDLLSSVDGCLQVTLTQVNGGANGVALRAGPAVTWPAQQDRLSSCIFGLAQLSQVAIDAGSMPPEAAFVEIEPFGIGLAASTEQSHGVGRVVESAMRLPGITCGGVRACLHGCLHREGPRRRDLGGDPAGSLRKLDCVLQAPQVNCLMAHGSQDPACEQPISRGTGAAQRAGEIPFCRVLLTSVICHPADVMLVFRDGLNETLADSALVTPIEQREDLGTLVHSGHGQRGSAAVRVVDGFQVCTHAAHSGQVAGGYRPRCIYRRGRRR